MSEEPGNKSPIMEQEEDKSNVEIKEEDHQRHLHHQQQQILMLPEGGYVLETGQGQFAPLTVAATVQFEDGFVDTDKLPSFNRILVAEKIKDEDDEDGGGVLLGGNGCDETLNSHVAAEEEIHDDRNHHEDAGKVDDGREKRLVEEKNKVYADLDAVPSSSTQYPPPYPPYYPQHPQAPAYYDPVPHQVYATEDMYAAIPAPPPPPVAAVAAVAAPQQPHYDHISQSVRAAAVSAGATLILPPDPNLSPVNDNHCILIQRVPQNKRKGKEAKGKTGANRFDDEYKRGMI